MSISEFIDTYKDAIARMVTEAYRPLYQPGNPLHREPLPPLVRPPWEPRSTPCGGPR